MESQVSADFELAFGLANAGADLHRLAFTLIKLKYLSSSQ
jgi:hypothetical protein